MSEFQIFDPTTPPQEKSIEFAPRPPSLRGLRLALVENTKFNSDKILLKIAALLEKEHGAKSHRIYSKRNAGVPADEKIIEDAAAHCDVIIAGVGD